MSIPTPNIIDLIRKMVGSHDEAELRQFFNLKRQPNETWIKTLAPGVEAAQRVLAPYLAEQQGGNSQEPAENQERAELCAELFGCKSASDLVFLRQLASSLKSHDALRIDFEKIEDGKIRLSVSNPSKGIGPTQVEASKAKLEEPAEGLIPSPAVAGSLLEELLLQMKPRLRLNPEHALCAESVLKAIVEGAWTRKVSMLLPIYGNVNPHVVYHWLAQIRKQPWLGVHYETETVIQRARNVLAQKFLASEAEWSVWFDADIIAPFGDPAFFYDEKRLNADPTFIKPEFVAGMAIERMLKAEKTIVGGVYHARRSGITAPMIIQPCLHPRDPKDVALVEELRANGPINRVIQVGYVATGCALVHRSVYRDIQAKFPERQPANPSEPYDFFGHDVGIGGEDIAFCGMAQQAGHASFLDLGLWCSHLGTQAFFTPRRA